MAKTAVASALSSIPAHTARSAGEQERGAAKQGGFRAASIEERTAILETRWEETVPALATRTDISDLRGEMRNLENRLIRWGVSGGIALLAVFAAVFIANTARMDSLDAKLGASVGKIDARIDKLDAKIDSRFEALLAHQDKLVARQDKLDAKVDSRFEALLARQDKLDAKVDSRFDTLVARQDALDAKLDARFDAMMAELRELRK